VETDFQSAWSSTKDRHWIAIFESNFKERKKRKKKMKWKEKKKTKKRRKKNEVKRKKENEEKKKKELSVEKLPLAPSLKSKPKTFPE